VGELFSHRRGRLLWPVEVIPGEARHGVGEEPWRRCWVAVPRWVVVEWKGGVERRWVGHVARVVVVQAVVQVVGHHRGRKAVRRREEVLGRRAGGEKEVLLGPCCFGKVGREREEGHGTGVRRRLVDRWEVPPRSAAPPPSPHGSGVAPPAVPWSGVAVLEARTTPVVDREEVLWIPRIAAAAVGAVAGAVGGKGWPASAAPLPAWPADVSWEIAPRHAARCHLARARVRGRTVLLFVR